ncbi:MAG: zinc-binding metallopeptidase family protein [Acidimicrobiales bacterium]
MKRAPSTYRCPGCGTFVLLENQECVACDAPIGFHWPTVSFVAAPSDGIDVDGHRWVRCTNWSWQCNWLVAEDSGSGQCLSCRLTRRRPDSDDTLALELLAAASLDKRRLLVQVLDLGLPITPHFEQDGGLAFDLVSSRSGERVTIGHANGVITIDLAEGQDAHREALRVSMGEAYRTMLGHFRHEIGHYYQQVLVTEDPWLAECRALFGDERASYSDAIGRHYRLGAPQGWERSFISEYATMHPWEDFAETFAHYLHITGTLATAARGGLVLRSAGLGPQMPAEVAARPSYLDADIDTVLDDWRWLAMFFNRINRSMGHRDLYPFAIVQPVADKLGFVHKLVQTCNG